MNLDAYRKRAAEAAYAAVGDPERCVSTSTDFVLYTLSPVGGEHVQRLADEPIRPASADVSYWAVFVFGIERLRLLDEGGAVFAPSAYVRGSYVAGLDPMPAPGARVVPLVGDLASGFAELQKKARLEMILKAAAVGVAGIGAIGLLVYAMRR